MGSITSSFYKDLKVLYNKKSFVFIIFFLFLFLYLILNINQQSFYINYKINILIINLDSSEASFDLINYFKNDNLFVVTSENGTLGNLDSESIIKGGKYDAILIIPKGFFSKLQNFETNLLDLYLISSDNDRTRLNYLTIREKLSEYFKEKFSSKIINQVNNQTGGSYSNLLNSSLNPYSLNVTFYLKKIQRKEKEFFFSSYSIQSAFFISLMISALLFKYEANSDIAIRIFTKGKRGIELLSSKLVLTSLLVLINVLLFFFIGSFLNVNISNLVSMIISNILISILSFGIAMILISVFSEKLPLEALLIVSLGFFLVFGLLIPDISILNSNISPFNIAIDLLINGLDNRIFMLIIYSLVSFSAGIFSYLFKLNLASKKISVY